MKRRLPDEAYKQLREIRDKYGESEYDRNDLIPAYIGVLRQHRHEDDLLAEAARAMLDRFEKADDEKQGELFHYDTHVALGERRRIKRGAMNLGQLQRRKLIIDENHERQNMAWARENHWIKSRSDALEGRAPETKISDVLNEDGTVRQEHAA